MRDTAAYQLLKESQSAMKFTKELNYTSPNKKPLGSFLPLFRRHGILLLQSCCPPGCETSSVLQANMLHSGFEIERNLCHVHLHANDLCNKSMALPH